MKTLNVSTVELAQEVLAHPAFAQALYDDGADAMSGVILTMHGEEYSVRRDLEMAFFDGPAISAFTKKHLKQFVDCAIDDTEASDFLDAVAFARYFSTCLAAQLIGLDVSCSDAERVRHLYRLVARFVEGATIVHSRLDKEKIRDDVGVAFDEFNEHFFEPAKRRLKSKGKDWEDCILQRYLDRRQALRLLDDQLMREIAFFLHAASAPTALSIVNTLHEVLMWIGSDKDRRRDLSRNPDLLAAAVNESLRLHPASPVAWRRALKPVKFSTGEWLDEGDYAIIDLLQINTDRYVYGADAREFNPLREHRASTSSVGLTFGAGYHSCPAKNMILGAEGFPGVLAGVISPLLRKGVVQNADQPAKLDQRTERPQWRQYPIAFDNALAI